MNETNKIKRPKFERTTQEQLQFFMQFCREHPQLQAGKNSPQAPRAVQNLWEEVVSNLNAMRGATRTTAKWKESWKNQLRSRARKAKAQGKATGGGPRTEDISEFEQQALETFGAAAVDGFSGVGVLGFQEFCQPPKETEPMESSPECVLSPNPSPNQPLIASPDESYDSTRLTTGTTPSKRKKISMEEIFEATMNSIKAREEREEKAIAEQAKREERAIAQQESIAGH